jgi:hypothetical protein
MIYGSNRSHPNGACCVPSRREPTTHRSAENLYCVRDDIERTDRLSKTVNGGDDFIDQNRPDTHEQAMQHAM